MIPESKNDIVLPSAPLGEESSRSRSEQNYGWWHRDAEQTRKKREAEAMRQRLDAIGLPPKFKRLIDKPLLSTPAMAETARGDLILVLAGPIGVGKTVAASAWLLDGWQTGSPLFVTSAHLARWDRYDDGQMRRLLGASKLVIDDLGEEYADAKGNFLSVFGEVVSGRHAGELPTVITTNLDATTFKERYGERVVDRIRESGRFVVLVGDSMRRKP